MSEDIVAKVKKMIKQRDEKVEKAMTVANKVGAKMAIKLVKEQLQDAVDEWYAFYDPRYYRRTYGLEDIAKVEIKGSGAEMYIDAYYDVSLMGGHNLGNEELYDLTIREGYHGGARSGPDHPNPGTPYYRIPVPYLSSGLPPYSQWGSPAVKTPSPLDLARPKVHEAANQVKEKIVETFWIYMMM